MKTKLLTSDIQQILFLFCSDLGIKLDSGAPSHMKALRKAVARLLLANKGGKFETL